MVRPVLGGYPVQMNLPRLLNEESRILMEAAVVERLRHAEDVSLHETLIHAPLIYQPRAGQSMADIYREYVSVALAADLPLLMCSPTWRCNAERVAECTGGGSTAGDARESINEDAVRFLRDLRAEYDNATDRLGIGGLLACKNDCYRPQQALSTEDAEVFHAWQVERLAGAGADFLIAETLPEALEALGIARAMERTGLPYVISFVIGRDGRILDGRPLAEAMDLIDCSTQQAPLGYMVNCAHPDFLRVDDQPEAVFTRLLGFLANASSLSHDQLEGADSVQVDDLDHWAHAMLRLNTRFGVKVLGGCCGTDRRHLELLAGPVR